MHELVPREPFRTGAHTSARTRVSETSVWASVLCSANWIRTRACQKHRTHCIDRGYGRSPVARVVSSVLFAAPVLSTTPSSCPPKATRHRRSRSTSARALTSADRSISIRSPERLHQPVVDGHEDEKRSYHDRHSRRRPVVERERDLVTPFATNGARRPQTTMTARSASRPPPLH